MEEKRPMTESDVLLGVFSSVFSDAIAAVAFENMVLRRLLNDKGIVPNTEFQAAQGELFQTQWEKARSELSVSIKNAIQQKFAEFVGGGSVH